MRALTAPALPTVSGLLDFIISDNQFLALLCRSVVGHLGSKCHLCGVGAKVLKVSNLTPVTSPTLHRGMSCSVSCSPVLPPLYLRAMEFPAGGRAINSHLPKHGVTRCLLGKIAHSHPKAPRQPWRHLPRRDLYAWQIIPHQCRSPLTHICGNISHQVNKCSFELMSD